MAIARLSNGTVLGSYEDINAALKPTEIGSFELPADTAMDVRKLPIPLTQEGADFITQSFDKTLDGDTRKEGYVYRRVGCIVPPGDDGIMKFSLKPGPEGERKVDDFRKMQVPHRAHVNEKHYVFTGAIIKGIRLENDLQAVLYITSGEWLKLHEVTLNWVIYPSGEPVNAISYYDREPDTEDMRYNISEESDFEILETMRF